MPKLKLMNITGDNIVVLKSLFLKIFNENSIDFDVLKWFLGEKKAR